MKKRNFVVTVKERQANQPCFLMFEPDEEIGIDGTVILEMPAGTDLEYAKTLARTINASVAAIKVVRF